MNRAMKAVGWAVGIGLLGCAGFCALRASPNMTEIVWLPRWLSVWADNYGVLRNVVAFAVVGVAVMAVAGTGHRITVTLAVFATGLEVAQLWIPERWFDWKDIVASLAGLAIAWAVVRLARLGFELCVSGFGLRNIASLPNAIVTRGDEDNRSTMREQVVEDIAA